MAAAKLALPKWQSQNETKITKKRQKNFFLL
jgi:hypothetical protein